LNTQELQVVSSINMGILTAEGAFFKTIEKDIGQYDDEIEIFWASELAFIRSVVYREYAGLMIFFAHQEEIDLCWRAINKAIR
jgi:GT2 family glycosyltransferase